GSTSRAGDRSGRAGGRWRATTAAPEAIVESSREAGTWPSPSLFHRGRPRGRPGGPVGPGSERSRLEFSAGLSADFELRRRLKGLARCQAEGTAATRAGNRVGRPRAGDAWGEASTGAAVPIHGVRGPVGGKNPSSVGPDDAT